MEKILRTQNWVRSWRFCHFLKVASLAFLDIAQDCSLAQCLISRTAETSKKTFCGLNRVEVIFSILMLSSAH